MNQGQEEKTCCASRTGIMAWIIHLCNIIVSLAVCVLFLGSLGVTLYVCFVPKADGPDVMDELLDLLIDNDGDGKSKLTWAFLVKDLSDSKEHTLWYSLLASLSTTGMCAMLSAFCSIVLLAKPRLHYAFYLSTWLYSGKFLLDGVLLFVSSITGTDVKGGRELVSKLCYISVFFTITQVILHTSVTVAMSKRDKGERSCCLPWNATSDGDIQCC